MVERCETCGDPATQWDYDQLMYFCDRDVQQADFTVPLGDMCKTCGKVQAQDFASATVYCACLDHLNEVRKRNGMPPIESGSGA